MIAYKGFAKVSCVENGSLGSPSSVGLAVGLAGGTKQALLRQEGVKLISVDPLRSKEGCIWQGKQILILIMVLLVM